MRWVDAPADGIQRCFLIDFSQQFTVLQVPHIHNSLGISRCQHLICVVELHTVNGMVMEKHLPLPLVLVVIQRVVAGVVQFNQPIDSTNRQVLLAPAQFQLSYLALLSVVDGLFDLFDDGLGLSLLFLLKA